MTSDKYEDEPFLGLPVSSEGSQIGPCHYNLVPQRFLYIAGSRTPARPKITHSTSPVQVPFIYYLTVVVGLWVPAHSSIPFCLFHQSSFA